MGKQLRGDIFAGIIPLMGMLISIRTMREGIVGGGRTTVNGAARGSCAFALPVGPLSDGVCFDAR